VSQAAAVFREEKRADVRRIKKKLVKNSVFRD